MSELCDRKNPSNKRVKATNDALRVVLQVVSAAPSTGSTIPEPVVATFQAGLSSPDLPHKIRFALSWILRTIGENGILFSTPVEVMGTPHQTVFFLPNSLASTPISKISSFAPLLDLSPAGKSLTRTYSLAAHIRINAHPDHTPDGLDVRYTEAVLPLLGHGYSESPVERKKDSVWSFGDGSGSSSSSASGGADPVGLSELDGSKSPGSLATVLSLTAKYSHEQLFGSLMFVTLKRALTSLPPHATVPPNLRDAIVGYCMRVLDQAERAESSGLYSSTSSSSSSFSLSKSRVNALDGGAVAAATLEAIQILDALALRDPEIVQDVYAIIQRVYARNMDRPASDGHVFLALVKFILHHGAVVGHSVDRAFSAYFQTFLPSHVSDPSVCVATMTFCLSNPEVESYLAPFFPSLLQAVAFQARSVGPDALVLFPSLVSRANAVEMIHAVLDLPLMTASLEARNDPDRVARPGYRVLYNHVLRSESGVSINFWESTTTAELMATFCAETRMSPRIHASAQLAPSLLALVLDTVLSLEVLDEDLGVDVFTSLLARFEQLFLLDLYTVATRAVLVAKMEALVVAFPRILARAKNEIVAYLAAGVSPGTLELHTLLVWAIGQFAAPETDPGFVSEVLDDLHSTLQVMVFEHIANASAGLDSLRHLGIDADALNRLIYILVSALAKLASRYQTLTPSVTLCLTKLLNKASFFHPYVIAAASQHIRLLQFPGMASALLASPVQSGFVDANSSLPFVLAAHGEPFGVGGEGGLHPFAL